jgi:uroporphyrinogen III methyltransferase / synthase
MAAAGLDWKPLSGKRIIITRPLSQAEGLVRGLMELGCEVLPLPTIRIEPPEDLGPLERACRNLRSFDWVVFTSANGVEWFWQTLGNVGGETEWLEGVSVCAIGSATARALERLGIRVRKVPPRYVAESIVEALQAEEDLEGKRILLPRAEGAREVLPTLLRQSGASIEDIPAYRTVQDRASGSRIRDELASGTIDLVVFTSGSTVRSLMEMVGGDVRDTPIASIGPVTSSVVREYGMRVAVEAEVHTSEGLISAVLEHFS